MDQPEQRKRQRDKDWDDQDDSPDRKRKRRERSSSPERRKYRKDPEDYGDRSPSRNYSRSPPHPSRSPPRRRELSPRDRRSPDRRNYDDYDSRRDRSPRDRRRDYYSPPRRNYGGGGRRKYSSPRNSPYYRRNNNNNRNQRYNKPRHEMPFFDDEDKQIREENSHLGQNKERIQKLDKPERLLLADAPRKIYYERKNELRTTNHWGQRKLLLSEIEFLTEYGHKSKVVVYAGAAPGAKNEYLANMFPSHKFFFVDPNPFHEKLKAAAAVNDRIVLINDFFTDETALSYKKDHVLFISDIRTADNKVMGEEEVEDTIVADNRMQMSWHLKMEPAASMLKFRLPWGKGITKYLSGYSKEGKIYLPVWGRQTTTETRLVAVGNETYDYDNTVYEEQLFQFNTVERCQYYKHEVDVEEVPGLCHCYDCASEIAILAQWAKKFSPEWCDSANPSDEEVNEWVARTCLQLNKECSASGNRDLKVQIGHNQNWFTPKRFDLDARVVINASGEELVKPPRSADFTRKPRGNEDLLAEISTENITPKDDETETKEAGEAETKEEEEEVETKKEGKEAEIEEKKVETKEVEETAGETVETKQL